MSSPLDPACHWQALSTVASRAIGATAAAPNLLAYALSALNDSSKAATHDENEELTLGRVRFP